MPDPAIIIAGLGAGVSLVTAASAAWAKRQAQAEDSRADVQVARLGDDATIREQLHSWLESERTGHLECHEEVARVRDEVAAARADLLAFRMKHPDCHERIASLTDRVRQLETRTPPPPPPPPAVEAEAAE